MNRLGNCVQEMSSFTCQSVSLSVRLPFFVRHSNLYRTYDFQMGLRQNKARRASGSAVRLDYVLTALSVQCSVVTPADQPKAAKLDVLLNLSTRWTREFKAEYVNLHGRLIRRVQRTQAGLNAADIGSYVQEWQADLVPSEPHHEVHQTLAAALQQPSRLAAWVEEIGSVNG